MGDVYLEEENAGADENDEEFISPFLVTALEPFSQDELNNLVRKLGVPKDSAELLLGFKIKKKLLERDTIFRFFMFGDMRIFYTKFSPVQ